MLCQDYPTALPLSPCTEDDARIYVGTTTLPVTHVRLKSLATGRIIQYDAVKDGNEVYFLPDGDVIVGQVYLFTILNNTVPLPFFPYAVSGYSLIPSTASAEGVYCTFTRFVEGYSFFEQGDQYITIE